MIIISLYNINILHNVASLIKVTQTQRFITFTKESNGYLNVDVLLCMHDNPLITYNIVNDLIFKINEDKSHDEFKLHALLNFRNDMGVVSAITKTFLSIMNSGEDYDFESVLVDRSKLPRTENTEQISYSTKLTNLITNESCTGFSNTPLYKRYMTNRMSYEMTLRGIHTYLRSPISNLVSMELFNERPYYKPLSDLKEN